MAYRRYSKRPRNYRRNYKRRTYRKPYNRKRNLSGRNKVYYFTRHTGAFGSLTINNITDTLVGYNFSLNDVVNYTEFTALYDMYKIKAVKISFLPQMTQNVSLSSVNNVNAGRRFFSAIDYNSDTAPTNIDELRDYKTCKYTNLLRKHTRYIYKPMILDGSSYSISPWMSTASPSINYYGLKVGVEPTDSTVSTTMLYEIECKYYLAFKNVR